MIRAAAFALSTLLFALPGPQTAAAADGDAATAEQIARLMELGGWTIAAEAGCRAEQAEFLVYALSHLPGAPDAAALRPVFAQVCDPAEEIARVAAALQGAVTQAEAETLLAFYDTPLGQRLSAAERALSAMLWDDLVVKIAPYAEGYIQGARVNLFNAEMMALEEPPRRAALAVRARAALQPVYDAAGAEQEAVTDPAQLERGFEFEGLLVRAYMLRDFSHEELQQVMCMRPHKTCARLIPAGAAVQGEVMVERLEQAAAEILTLMQGAKE